ncbi:MAG: response regulator [Monoglobaceae bacterium]
MYKVLLVDDEPLIIKSLIKIIRDETDEFEICGEAVNGADGFEKIKELRPDIVITDICMSKMTGIEMIEKINDIIPQGKIIILTGYRDFEYAQQAVNLGVCGFLLKPMKSEEVVNAIRTAAAQIETERVKEKQIEAYNEMFVKDLSYMNQKLIRDIMTGERRYDGQNYKIADEQCNIEIDKFYLLFICIAEQSANEAAYMICEYVAELIENAVNGKALHIYIDLHNMVLILEAKDDIEYVEEQSRKAIDRAKEEKGIDGCIGISTRGSGVGDLHLKYIECREAVADAVRKESGPVAVFERQEKAADDELLALKENIILRMEKKDYNKARRYIDDIIAASCGNSDSELDKYKEIYNQIISYMIDNCGHAYDEAFKLSRMCSIGKNIQICRNKQELDEMLKMIADSAFAKNSADDSNNGAVRKVKKIIEYIDENYYKNIKLDDIAKHMLMSSFYTSRIFKKETGKNLVDYINEVRVNKAMQMMRENDMKIYQVAEQVGIDNTQYFSKIFKKYCGQTPTEYMESLYKKNKE